MMESINFAAPNISMAGVSASAEDGLCGSGPRDGPGGGLYSFPGILHFLQAEWNRMETERAHWEIERAELTARIAFLQGEKKGQECLKEDLVRRIKMLEFALKQKNQMIVELKYGAGKTNSNATTVTDAHTDTTIKPRIEANAKLSADIEKARSASAEWRESRQRLRQFLQEVGYVDAVVDARQVRLRGLFGGDNEQPGRVRHDDQQMMDAERLAMRSFDFLTRGGQDKDNGKMDADRPVDEDNNWLDHLSGRIALAQRKGGMKDDRQYGGGFKDKYKAFSKSDKFGRLSKKDSELQDFLSQLSDDNFQNDDFMVDKSGSIDGANKDKKSLIQNTDMDNYTNNYGLGDLEGITVANDADGDNPDIAKSFCGSAPLSAAGINSIAIDKIDGNSTGAMADAGVVKKLWNVKYTLRGHFDSVRCISFYRSESAILSGSDDGTVKVWNFNKTQLSKKGPNMEMEAVQTMRGHDGPVLAVQVLGDELQCPMAVSGGLDGAIRLWNLPSLDIDPYELFDRSQNALHIPDAHGADHKPVWLVEYMAGSGGDQPVLVSVSSNDVRLWRLLIGSTGADNDLNSDYRVYQGLSGDLAAQMIKEVPVHSICNLGDTDTRISRACLLKTEGSGQMVVGTSRGGLHVIDLNADAVVKYSANLGGNNGVNDNGGWWGEQAITSVCSHPTMPLVLVGCDDHCLRTVDLRAGSGVVHSMVVHQDAVSCLDVDKNGIYLVTGSHDGSLRMWDLDKKSCIQEIACHRVKNNESIHAVQFHPQMPFIASCGSEGIVKIYS